MSLIALHQKIGTTCHQVVMSCSAAYERLRHPYRPELHYMRGPGPKWHERHVVLVGASHPQRGAEGLQRQR